MENIYESLKPMLNSSKVNLTSLMLKRSNIFKTPSSEHNEHISKQIHKVKLTQEDINYFQYLPLDYHKPKKPNHDTKGNTTEDSRVEFARYHL